MKAYGVCSNSGEKKQKAGGGTGGQRPEQDKQCTRNRRRVPGRVRQSYCGGDGELVERSFAHCYERRAAALPSARTGNILKRQLVHVGGSI